MKAFVGNMPDALVGKRLGRHYCGKRTSRTRIIAGLKQGEPPAPLYFEGYCNTEAVLCWMKEVLLPELQPGMTVIWDNPCLRRGRLQVFINPLSLRLAQALFNEWNVMLNPAVQRGMIQLDSSLFQHFFQFSVADALFTVPPHRPKDDLASKLTTLEIVHADFLFLLLFKQKMKSGKNCNSARLSNMSFV